MEAWVPPTAPPCPSCGKPMALARILPRLGGAPELRTFQCHPCGVVQTEAVSPERHAPLRG